MPDNRPMLVVDVDGVLNPYGGPCPEGYAEHALFPDDNEPVRLCPHHAAWLRELAGPYDLVWGTSWSAADRSLLATVLDLPLFTGAARMPPAPFDPALKIPAIDRHGAGRPLSWVDDLLGPEAWAWAAGRTAPTLLVPVDPANGLARYHVDRLLDWAREDAPVRSLR